MSRFLSDLLFAVAFFAALLLCGVSPSHAASFQGVGCYGSLDNFVDGNGSFARCSVPFTVTTSAADMVSCDGYITPVAAAGYYLACSASWQKGAGGYSMAECPGGFSDDPSGHFMVCSASWRPFVNRPPAVDPLIVNHINGTTDTFEFSQLETSKVAQYFAAGVVSLFTFWFFGEAIGALLAMIRRGGRR